MPAAVGVVATVLNAPVVVPEAFTIAILAVLVRRKLPLGGKSRRHSGGHKHCYERNHHEGKKRASQRVFTSLPSIRNKTGFLTVT
jgi:hypothetical protein